jgi:hypothetical protein
MSGGAITGNTSDNGGGVNVLGVSSNVAEFTMSGGTIFGNTAVDGGGVAIFEYTQFIMSGGAKVDTNNPVHLASNRYITIGGTLTGTEIVANIVPSNSVAGTQLLDPASPSGLVSANYQRFTVNGISAGTSGGLGSDGKIH